MSTLICTNTAPEDALLSRMSDLLRTGPGAAFGSPWNGYAAWTEGQPCPANHWLMPQGSGLYRYDFEGRVAPPAAVLYLEKDSTSYTPFDNQLFWIHPLVDLSFPRDAAPAAPESLKLLLQHVFTADLRKADGSTETARARLSAAPSGSVPGCSVKVIKDVFVERLQEDELKHVRYTLAFTVLAEALFLI